MGKFAAAEEIAKKAGLLDHVFGESRMLKWLTKSVATMGLIGGGLAAGRELASEAGGILNDAANSGANLYNYPKMLLDAATLSSDLQTEGFFGHKTRKDLAHFITRYGMKEVLQRVFGLEPWLAVLISSFIPPQLVAGILDPEAAKENAAEAGKDAGGANTSEQQTSKTDDKTGLPQPSIGTDSLIVGTGTATMAAIKTGFEAGGKQTITPGLKAGLMTIERGGVKTGIKAGVKTFLKKIPLLGAIVAAGYGAEEIYEVATDHNASWTKLGSTVATTAIDTVGGVGGVITMAATEAAHQGVTEGVKYVAGEKNAPSDADTVALAKMGYGLVVGGSAKVDEAKSQYTPTDKVALTRDITTNHG